MGTISSDGEFKQAVGQLSPERQRAVGALFVEHVLALSGDARIEYVIQTAAKPDAGKDELARALKEAKGATMDSYTHCGEQCNWAEQGGYFVARAAEALVTPIEQSKAGGPAWQTAMYCRMARNCEAIEQGMPEGNKEESEQYRMLNEFLGSD